MHKLFITGTGTNIGKTMLTCVLAYQWRLKGRQVAALKPVVSGYTPEDASSDPALLLRALGSNAAHETISPWRFAAPLAPDMAAAKEGKTLALEEIIAFCNAQTVEYVLIEGAGGVMSPLTAQHTNLDLIRALGCEVVLAAGNYLGAISHTLTALHALRSSGIGVRGVVINTVSDNVSAEDTAAAIHRFTQDRVPVYILPKLPGAPPEEQWRAAPHWADLCN